MGCGSISRLPRDRIQLNAFITDRQVELVKQSMELVKDEIVTTGLLMYANFLEKELDLRRFFPHLMSEECACEGDMESLKRHSVAVMHGLCAAVESIDDSSTLDIILVDLGEKHSGMKVKARYLERMWPSIDFAFKEILQDVYTRQVKEAWKQIFMYITTKMKEGMVNARITGPDIIRRQISSRTDFSNDKDSVFKITSPAKPADDIAVSS